jgi:hypothetical protein
MQILPIAQSKPIGISDGAFLGRTLVLTSLAKASSFSKGHLAWVAVVCTAGQFGWLASFERTLV